MKLEQNFQTITAFTRMAQRQAMQWLLLQSLLHIVCQKHTTKVIQYFRYYSPVSQQVQWTLQ